VCEYRFHARPGLAAVAWQRAHIPFIKIHTNNATHRPTAMIAKDLILTKDNCRIH